MLTPEFLKSPNPTEKKWGSELTIVNNESYCGKFLQFNAGSKISNHFHLKKNETWYILEGALNFSYFDYESGVEKTQTLKHGDIVNIPNGVLHTAEAKEDSLIVEFSTQHFDSDSYRIKPSRGKAAKA